MKHHSLPFLGILATFLCILSALPTLAADARPNIIVFYSDDHGYADLGIQGVLSDLKTPNLDALARSGVVVKNGYSTAPQCVPSRGGLMVGKFQGRFQLDNNGSSLDGFNKETTFATRLQKAGYATAQFGKWHLGPTTEIPKHGFMHSFSQNAQRPFTANLSIDGKDRPMSELAPEDYHVTACSRAASAVIERYKDQPFFLYVAYRAPHTPLDAPEKFTSRFPDTLPGRRRQALAMISAIDDGVGMITDTLRRLDLAERTLIFFIGDNGAPLKIHKIDSPLNGDAGGWDGSLNTPLNGEKGMLAEGGMHVPFLVSWPGRIPALQKYPHAISALDVAATATAVANIQVESGALDGVNLIPYLSGEKTTAPHESLMWRWSAQSAIREGNWKLLRGGEREYLFDLNNDLEEQHNLAQKHPEIASRLRSKLKAWSEELNPPGMAIGSMAKAWTDYFDHYLDGKLIPPPAAEPSANSSSDSKVQGWQARGGTLTAIDDYMQLKSDATSRAKSAFVTRAGIRVPGPGVVRFQLKSPSAGSGAIAWRTDGDKDFVPEKRVNFAISTSEEWRTYEVPIDTNESIVHVRVHFPAGTILIRQLEVQRK